MTFGWQGFSFEHPDDWAPVALTGGRETGYTRIASPSKLSFQVRWESVRRPGDLRARLAAYLERLERDAIKANRSFHRDIDEEGDRLLYRWTGVGQGRGAIFHSAPCSRVFIIEAIADRKESLLKPFRGLHDSFFAFADGRETWSLLGLGVSLPTGLTLERKDLRSGRTELGFKGKGVRIEASRWGFGEQLIQKHGLEQWTRATFGMPSDSADVGEGRVSLVRPGSLTRPAQWGLAAYQADQNQIVALRVTSRLERWRPDWDWLM